MQNDNTIKCATQVADQLISERFGREYGVNTFADYLDRVDRRSTLHLDDYMAGRVVRTAGAQRRGARLMVEGSGPVIIAVPIRDNRAGQTRWAETELSIWLDLMEMGADGAWFFVYKGRDRGDGQVKTGVPLRSSVTNDRVAIARLITNAKPGQQARTLDRNTLNLRRANVFLIGSPKSIPQRSAPVSLIGDRAARRKALAGAAYGAAADVQM